MSTLTKKQVILNIALKRHLNDLKRRRKKKSKRRTRHQSYLAELELLGGSVSSESIIAHYLPPTIEYLLKNERSAFFIDDLIKDALVLKKTLYVPVHFSIIEKPQESYSFLKELMSLLVYQSCENIDVDYSKCNRIDLETQVLFDIILKDVVVFYKKCNNFPKYSSRVKSINGVNIVDQDLRKMLFSVGSPAIHNAKHTNYPDIIRYPLCILDTTTINNPIKRMNQKDLDTTELVEYVINSLDRMHKKLTPEKLEDLCTVIGEILINAEEHSTTKNRFSIGYFQEKNSTGKHFGIFRLVILNFGQTIYEKFKDPNCKNQDIVEKMKVLSESYTKRNLLRRKKFEEETLWTLYALQEGITSVPTTKNKKRGNGSIRFIESFFNIKSSVAADSFSQLTLLSGNTQITFDGTYNIVDKLIGDEKFRVMTFNNTGSIEDRPDYRFVRCIDNHFPGTIITANILLNDDDLINGN